VVGAPQTIFHPQGGGQPTDVGIIQSPTGNFTVTKVEMRKEDNVILHLGTFANADTSGFTAGATVSLVVDEATRRLNARIHSAGHLLDAAMRNTGRTDLVPSKGYHFPSGPYVEYVGSVEAVGDGTPTCALLACLRVHVCVCVCVCVCE
jgi:Ser-tRNA(Ala) deacylase AlaX